MDKKFISGLTFGVVLGTVISVSIPMFAAKDITVGKTKTTTQTKSTGTKAADPNQSDNSMSGEMVQQLKDMNSSLKENASQNKEIIVQLQNLNKKNGL